MVANIISRAHISGHSWRKKRGREKKKEKGEEITINS
jgi:hypothetical protein